MSTPASRAAQRANYPIRKTTLAEQDLDPELDEMSAAERMEMMWQLAQDAWAFMEKPVGESRLPRHIVRVYRRRR